MLHTKFQGHCPSGSEVEDFYMVLSIYGHVGHLSHVTKIIYINLIILL